MKNSKLFNLLWPALALIIICLVISSALAGVNALTADAIENLAEQSRSEAMAHVLKADEYRPIELADGGSDTCYAAVTGGKTVGYVFDISARGYGGDVEVMTGIGDDGIITNVEIIDASNETPGLGGNATKPGFAEQYSGLFGEIGITKSTPGENEISALTGATITTRAVTASVNKALDYYENQLKGAEAQ